MINDYLLAISSNWIFGFDFEFSVNRIKSGSHRDVYTG
jgi:hypothetical protein